MSDRKPPSPSTPPDARARHLVDVSNQLADMIASLRKNRESIQSRLSEPALTPRPGTHPPVSPTAGGEVERLRAELQRAREAEAALRDRLDEIETTHRAVGDDLVGLQAQIAHAAGLSVTLRRLHEAGSRPEVLDGLQEAIINILGCEDFVVLVEGPRGGLAVARRMGRSPADADALAAGPGLAEALGRGEVLVGPAVAALHPDLTALLPLQARGRLVGAAALFRLLPQKERLDALDDEVLDLLHLHAALAWLAAPEAPGDGTR